MPRAIDERGNVFGIVNIIDLLVVLLVTAIATASIALFAPQLLSISFLLRNPSSILIGSLVLGILVAILLWSEIPTPTRQVADVELLVNVPDFVLNSVGDVAESSDVVVNNIDDTVSLSVPVSFNDPSKIRYNGDRLYLGKEMTVDLGRVILTGKIVYLSEGYRTELE